MPHVAAGMLFSVRKASRTPWSSGRDEGNKHVLVAHERPASAPAHGFQRPQGEPNTMDHLDQLFFISNGNYKECKNP